MTTTTARLVPDHGWRARPGCKIFVFDRGAVRFDYPADWVVAAGESSVEFRDREPPNDESLFEVSFLRIPLIDWSGLPVADLVDAAMGGDVRPDAMRGPLREEQQRSIEIGWREVRFIDATTGRRARSRLCVARGGTIQCLLTFAFWESDYVRSDAAWHIVLETLTLDEVIKDPRRGLKAR